MGFINTYLALLKSHKVLSCQDAFWVLPGFTVLSSQCVRRAGGSLS